MVCKKGHNGHSIITKRGLEKHFNEKEVMVRLLDKSGAEVSLPSRRGVLFSDGGSVYFRPDVRRHSVPVFELVEGRASVGFLTKYPSTCKHSKGASFYRFYDYESR